jgi:glutamate synthase (NADPH/NADH) large chain
MTGGTAVILGKTGRNFGAGMSGGRAFVYKLRHDRINHEALVEGELNLEKPSESIREEIRLLISEHQLNTGSILAAEMLANFDSVIDDFTVVTPRDYANVLEVRSVAVSQGLDPDSPEVWERILEVTNG